MRGGLLRHRLEIQSRNDQKDGYGNSSSKGSWATDATVFGQIRPLGVVERQEAAKSTGNASHQAVIRAYGVRVTPKHRIRYYDAQEDRYRLFEIVGTLNFDERNIEKRILCKEQT